MVAYTLFLWPFLSVTDHVSHLHKSTGKIHPTFQKWRSSEVLLIFSALLGTAAHIK